MVAWALQCQQHKMPAANKGAPATPETAAASTIRGLLVLQAALCLLCVRMCVCVS